MDTHTADDTWACLCDIAQLLHQATVQLWETAEPDSELQSLALGVYLVQAQIVTLLPNDHAVPELNMKDLQGQTPLQLLTAAELLSRPLPVYRPDLVNSAQLALDLCDLIREASELECC